LRVPGYRVRLKINRLNPYPPLTLPAPKSIPDASRVSGSFWQIGNRACATGLRSSSPATVLFRARATLDLRLELAKEADSSRLAEVCFAPAVPGLSHPLGALHRFRPITRIETSPQAPIAVEEHFASGLALWTGETADWTSDAAGARPAGLALFEPSLGLADYQFEFLTRIEKEGVTFVLRALNPGNHHRITIRRSSSGDWELVRCVTIGGVEEDVATVPMNTPPRTSAFTVMAQARRNDLSVFVDGEPVARWTDGRLPRGGAGFLSLRNHQARIYSVRLTHLGAHITAPGSKISLRSKQ
jgi:hypothetical protein